MNRIDTKKILNKTNQLIGYENYESEERVLKRNFRNISFVLVAVILIVGGTFTVNAMSDNSIVEGIKNILTIKVNGEEKNAKCEKNNDGTLKCTLDQEVLGDDSEVSIDIDEQKINDAKFNVNIEDENKVTEIEINSTNDLKD